MTLAFATADGLEGQVTQQTVQKLAIPAGEYVVSLNAVLIGTAGQKDNGECDLSYSTGGGVTADDSHYFAADGDSVTLSFEETASTPVATTLVMTCAKELADDGIDVDDASIIATKVSSINAM